jgi:FecR protein
VKAFFRWHLPILAAVLLAFSGGSALAQSSAAGRFLSVTGDVGVVGADGKRRAAARGGEFREGETVVTGSNALAQLRTADGGLLSVRADTEMKLDKFAYAGENDTNASFLVSLVKGGFRTITGLIGRANRDGYRITTPSATIGIRGTHYEVVHVSQPVASQQVPAGTYNRVFDGITTFQNKTGVLLLVNRDQTAFVGLPGNVAPVLITPPVQIFGKPTPVPRLVPQSSTSGPSGGGGDTRGQTATGGVLSTPVTTVRPATTLTPLTTISPIDSTTAVKPSTTTTLSPTTSTLVSPITTTTTISPTTTLSPTMTTVSPTTTISPSTTTISPTTTTVQPTTTLSPSTTTLSPTMITK